MAARKSHLESVSSMKPLQGQELWSTFVKILRWSWFPVRMLKAENVTEGLVSVDPLTAGAGRSDDNTKWAIERLCMFDMAGLGVGGKVSRGQGNSDPSQRAGWQPADGFRAFAAPAWVPQPAGAAAWLLQAGLALRPSLLRQASSCHCHRFRCFVFFWLIHITAAKPELHTSPTPCMSFPLASCWLS